MRYVVASRRARARLVALLALAPLAACRSTMLPAVEQNVAAPKVPSPADGRGSLVGIVADSATGYPIVGADVYFTRDTVLGSGPARPRTDLPRATTDRSGGFALLNVPPGEYTLAFSDLDHYPMRTIVLVRVGQVHSVELRPRRR
jgi:Carboxypeptidase regulatory-like domain